MHKTVTRSFAILLVAFLPDSTLAGPDYDEGFIDAGRTISTAQTVAGSGELQTITGRLEGPAVPHAAGRGSSGDYEDVFMFEITNPKAFSASTSTLLAGFADFNTELFLFDANGRGILANDDSNGSQQSTLPNAADDGSGAFVMAPGVYFIAISGSDDNPTDGGGQLIFDQADPLEVSGPDGPGGSNPQEDWDGTGEGEVGDYTIALTGSGFIESIPTVSEWGLIILSLLILTVGTIVFGRRRPALAAAQ